MYRPSIYSHIIKHEYNMNHRIIIIILLTLLFQMINSLPMSMSSSSSSCSSNPSNIQSVAIIGAGAAGLACARAFSRWNENGKGVFKIRVFEKEEGVAGVWRYDNSADVNDNARKVKVRPMYRNLRTNLPREIMGFREKPWGHWIDDHSSSTYGYGDADGMSFVTHTEVKEYLTDYARQFNLTKYIEHGTEVTHLKNLYHSNDHNGWSPISLKWKSKKNDNEEEGVFDIVCVANGHYSAPAQLQLDASLFTKGEVMHAIEYDEPSKFAGKTVLCVGARASGSDMAREISAHARKVYLSDSTCPAIKIGELPQMFGNVTLMPRTLAIGEDSVDFLSNHGKYTVNDIDTILFCNGYDYDFPFINDDSNLGDLWSCKKGERRIAPLYHQLWHAQYPSLAFLGLPHSVLPFPMFELQAEAIINQHRLLSPLSTRMESAIADAESGGPVNPGRVQDTHFLGGFQWDYCRTLAKLAGKYDEKMERYISGNKVSNKCNSVYNYHHDASCQTDMLS